MNSFNWSSMRPRTLLLILVVSLCCCSCGRDAGGDDANRNPILEALKQKLADKLTPEVRDRVMEAMKQTQPEMKQCHDTYLKDVADGCGLSFEQVEGAVPKGSSRDAPGELGPLLEGVAGKPLTGEQQQKVQSAFDKLESCTQPLRSKMLKDVAAAAEVSEEELQDLLAKGEGGPGGEGSKNPVLQALMKKMGAEFTPEVRSKVRAAMQKSQLDMKECLDTCSNAVAAAAGLTPQQAEQVYPKRPQPGHEAPQTGDELRRRAEGVLGKPLQPDQIQKLADALKTRDGCAQPIHQRMLRDVATAAGIAPDEMREIIPGAAGPGTPGGAPKNPILQALAAKLGSKFTPEMSVKVGAVMQQSQSQMKACQDSFVSDVVSRCGLTAEAVEKAMPKQEGDQAALGKSLETALGKPLTADQQKALQAAMQKRGQCAGPVAEQMFQGVSAVTGLSVADVQATFPHGGGKGQ